MMTNTPECVFCQIAIRKLPAEILYEDVNLIVIKDSKPIAPVHLLVIPKKHIASLNDATSVDQEIFGKMILVARDHARQLGVERSGYRLVMNTGPNAGQSIFHIHLHVIGGRHLPFKFN
jgi:histidine triad (HIT) family protein